MAHQKPRNGWHYDAGWQPRLPRSAWLWWQPRHWSSLWHFMASWTINFHADPDCYRTTDTDTALGNSQGLDITIVPGSEQPSHQPIHYLQFFCSTSSHRIWSIVFLSLPFFHHIFAHHNRTHLPHATRCRASLQMSSRQPRPWMSGIASGMLWMSSYGWLGLHKNIFKNYLILPITALSI